MPLDETAHAALRRLRVQSTPLPADRARIKARLAPILLPAPPSGPEPPLPGSDSASPSASAQHGTGTGKEPLGLPEPNQMTAGGSGVSSGGLAGTLAVKLGAVVLSAGLATAAWVGVLPRGASPRASATSSAEQRSVPPSASFVASSADERSEPVPSSLRESESGHQRDDRAAALPAAAQPAATQPAAPHAAGKPRRGDAARSQSVAAPARDALQSEVEALRAAQEALRDGDPQAALRQLERRERSIQLARDREGLRAVALCDAKQGEAGRKAAEQFLRRHSSSALARRVRAACAKYLLSGTDDRLR